jgi:hypothetical protein
MITVSGTPITEMQAGTPTTYMYMQAGAPVTVRFHSTEGKKKFKGTIALV